MIWILFLKLMYCELEVRIADGVLKGQVLQARDGRTYYSHTAIPYAKPPIGELRFKVLTSNMIFNIHNIHIHPKREITILNF